MTKYEIAQLIRALLDVEDISELIDAVLSLADMVEDDEEDDCE